MSHLKVRININLKDSHFRTCIVLMHINFLDDISCEELNRKEYVCQLCFTHYVRTRVQYVYICDLHNNNLLKHIF